MEINYYISIYKNTLCYIYIFILYVNKLLHMIYSIYINYNKQYLHIK